jgi:hypothetical protein
MQSELQIVADAQESAEAVAVIAPATTVRPALNVVRAETVSVLSRLAAPLALNVQRTVRILVGAGYAPETSAPTVIDNAPM